MARPKSEKGGRKYIDIYVALLRKFIRKANMIITYTGYDSDVTVDIASNKMYNNAIN